MGGWSPETAARWLAEAVETGNPLAALPEEIAPRDLPQAEEVSAAVLDALGIAPCGLRLLRREDGTVLAGPMVEGRLVPSGAAVALRSIRHPVATAAVVGVLAAPLEPGDDAPPAFARLHPAIDIAATRFTEAPADAVALTADLGRLGLVVAGKGKALPPGPLRIALGLKEGRRRGQEMDIAAALAEAGRAARAWGGLPAGALLVVAGLTPPAAAEGRLRASLGALGGAEVLFS
ncbi:hypothetical protein [Falsiroseomonas sp. CW058]|uniref:hypothetical protein n=1 Tax=Falsiroseomonas sp. CW058 TaxID=3388664 RepID=UPI003D319067